jgi:hypothetical protein
MKTHIRQIILPDNKIIHNSQIAVVSSREKDIILPSNQIIHDPLVILVGSRDIKTGTKLPSDNNKNIK